MKKYSSNLENFKLNNYEFNILIKNSNLNINDLMNHVKKENLFQISYGAKNNYGIMKRRYKTLTKELLNYYKLKAELKEKEVIIFFTIIKTNKLLKDFLSTDSILEYKYFEKKDFYNFLDEIGLDNSNVEKWGDATRKRLFKETIKLLLDLNFIEIFDKVYKVKKVLIPNDLIKIIDDKEFLKIIGINN